MLLNIRRPSPALFNFHAVLRGGYYHSLPFLDKETESERSKGSFPESDVWKVVGLNMSPSSQPQSPFWPWSLCTLPSGRAFSDGFVRSTNGPHLQRWETLQSSPQVCQGTLLWHRRFLGWGHYSNQSSWYRRAGSNECREIRTGLSTHNS